MKRTALGATLAFAVTSGAAIAADIPPRTYAPAPYAAVPAFYSWMGPYVGANLGYQWGNTTNNPTNPAGIFGGLQTGQFVFGLEGDMQLSSADDVFAPWKFANPWFGTARGRAGIAVNNILFYGTGGLAFGNLRADNLGLSENRTHAGWTVGAGMEVGLTPNWSAKAEYLYFDLTDRGYSVTGVNNGLESSLLRFGVNYRF
jgi:outer membrane immunogenic protein